MPFAHRVPLPRPAAVGVLRQPTTEPPQCTTVRYSLELPPLHPWPLVQPVLKVVLLLICDIFSIRHFDAHLGCETLGTTVNVACDPGPKHACPTPDRVLPPNVASVQLDGYDNVVHNIILDSSQWYIMYEDPRRSHWLAISGGS